MNFISLLFCVHHFLCYVYIYIFMWERAFCFNCSTTTMCLMLTFYLDFTSLYERFGRLLFKHFHHSFLFLVFFFCFSLFILCHSCVLLHLAFTLMLLLKEEERWEIRQRHARVYTYSNIFCNDVLFIIVRMIRSKKMREVPQ